MAIVETATLKSSQPKFSEVLRAYAKGLTAPWDRQFKDLKPGQCVTYFVDPANVKTEHQARSTRAAFEELAKLYEIYEK